MNAERKLRQIESAKAWTERRNDSKMYGVQLTVFKNPELARAIHTAIDASKDGKAEQAVRALTPLVALVDELQKQK